MNTPSLELKYSEPLDAIGLLADISTRVINAQTLADALYDSIMSDDEDAPLSLTLILQEQLSLLNQLVEKFKSSDLEVQP